MFFRLFAVFALMAVAFANPKPEPQPQYLTYGASYSPVAYSAYSPVAYSAPYAAAAYPYAYSGYYVR